MEEGPYGWIHVECLALSHQANDTVGFFVWTMEMATMLATTLGGYQYWFGRDAPQFQEVPPATLPPHIPLEHVPLLLQHADSTLCIADTLDCPVLFLLTYHCFALR